MNDHAKKYSPGRTDDTTKSLITRRSRQRTEKKTSTPLKLII